MNSARLSLREHSTARDDLLKLPICLAVALVLVAASAPPEQPTGNATLRAELTELLQAGDTAAAVRHAQAALQAHPADAGIRHEYVTLHLALARDWLTSQRYDAAATALAAALAVEPQQPQALALRRELEAPRSAAGQAVGEIDQLLRIELFETALEQIKEVKSLRPDLAGELAAAERAAGLGAADDHYLAGNFHEAFALYERLTAVEPEAGAELRTRWLLALTLALGEGNSAPRMAEDVAVRVLARLRAFLPGEEAPLPAEVVRGLLAEQAGQLLEAGHVYAAALQAPWALPPVDRRRDAVATLRRQALDLVRNRYRATPTGRRGDFWTLALPNVWKQRRTPHFDVYARNDLIAARVAEALEYHYPRLAVWLGTPRQETWDPRLEVRVHGSMESLHAATGTSGDTRAVSDLRLQGSRILLRKLAVCQADPWLLSATLPHELVHALLIDAQPTHPPLPALATGLALQAEPPARRLLHQRLLDPQPPAPTELLAAQSSPNDLERFAARCDALTCWLLVRQAQSTGYSSDRPPISELLATCGPDVQADWWAYFGWESSAAMLTDWRAWVAARRHPPRMPLVLLVWPGQSPQPERRARPEDTP